MPKESPRKNLSPLKLAEAEAAVNALVKTAPQFRDKKAIKARRYTEAHCLTAAVGIRDALRGIGIDARLVAGWRNVQSDCGDYTKLSHVVTTFEIPGTYQDIESDWKGTQALSRWEEDWDFQDEDGDTWDFDWDDIRARDKALEAFAKKHDIQFDRAEAAQIAAALTKSPRLRELREIIEKNRPRGTQPLEKTQQKTTRPKRTGRGR